MGLDMYNMFVRCTYTIKYINITLIRMLQKDSTYVKFKTNKTDTPLSAC